MSFNVTAVLDFIVALFRPLPERELIPIRVDRRRPRR